MLSLIQTDSSWQDRECQSAYSHTSLADPQITVIRAKSQEKKATLQWGKTERKQGEAMGSSRWTVWRVSSSLVCRNNAGRKLEGILELFLCQSDKLP